MGYAQGYSQSSAFYQDALSDGILEVCRVFSWVLEDR